MQDVNKLRVWHEARAVAVLVYQRTRTIRPRQFPGLSAQLQRASTSIGANIAEGASHVSAREFARYLEQALASAAEVEHHACAAGDLGALSAATSEEIAARCRILQRMLVSLHRRVLSPEPPQIPKTINALKRSRKPKTTNRPPKPKTPSNGC